LHLCEDGDELDTWEEFYTEFHTDRGEYELLNIRTARQNSKNIVAGNNCTEIKEKYNYVVAIEKIEEGLTKRIEFTALEHAAAYYNKSTRTIFRVIREKSSLKSINVTFELL
jgi:hypothetical protein